MEIEVTYAPRYVRAFKKLPIDLQDEVYGKTELFKNSENHKQLKVHNLKGAWKGFHSFSVNYRTRIIFEYVAKNKCAVYFLSVGDHDIYK